MREQSFSLSVGTEEKLKLLKHHTSFFILLVLIASSSVFAQLHPPFRFAPSLPLASIHHDQVILVDIDIEDQLDPEEVPARDAGGWGFSTPKSAEFLSESSSITSDESVVLSYFGNHEISGDLWIKPNAPDGTIMSWGDSLGLHFITVFLENNYLNIHRYYVDSLFAMTSEVLIDTTIWSHIYWVNRVQNSYVEFQVYINGDSIAHDSELLNDFPPSFTMINSPIIVGASTDPRTFGPSFTGKIMGVSLNGYTRSEEYLTSTPPFDGSEFFGMSLYLERGSDKRITVSPTPVAKRAFVPYSNDFYIPQGVASTYEDRRAPTDDNMVYLSMYHKDIDGNVAGNKSLVVEMDPENGYQVRRCFRFTSGPIYGHLASMAYCADYLYVGSESIVYQCLLPEYDPADGKYFDLDPINSYSLLSSNLDFFNDTLWVASWGRYNTADRAFLFGYAINENGDIDLSGTPARYEIPNTNQGAGWTEYGGEQYLFVHTSYGGTNNSKLHRFRKDQLRPLELSIAERIFDLPAGGEDMSFNTEGNLITVSESSSRAYQLRTYYSPWNQYYPFIFEISPEVLFSDVDTTTVSTILGDDDLLMPSELFVSAFPNPFNGSISVHYELDTDMPLRIRVLDVRGRIVDTLLDERAHRMGNYQLSWSPRSLPSGIYILSFESQGRQLMTQKIVSIK